MFSPLLSFEHEKTLKNVSKKLCMYTSKIEKKKEAETKSSVWDLKNALTSTNPRTVKWYEAGMCIGLFSFLHHRIKQIESMLPWVCSENISDDCRTAEARFAAKHS